MYKYENLDNSRKREHILEITIQEGRYIGSIKQKISGNCLGLDVLHTFNPKCICSDKELYENNCKFHVVSDRDIPVYFKCILKDNENRKLEVEDCLDNLQNYVVKLEIIACEIVKRKTMDIN